MKWLKRLFHKHELNKSLDAQIDALDGADSLVPSSPPFEGAGSSPEEMGVTAQYSLLSKEIDKAIDAKLDAHDAAVRVTTAIGSSPSATPGPDRGIKIPHRK